MVVAQVTEGTLAGRQRPIAGCLPALGPQAQAAGLAGTLGFGAAFQDALLQQAGAGLHPLAGQQLGARAKRQGRQEPQHGGADHQFRQGEGGVGVGGRLMASPPLRPQGRTAHRPPV